MCSEGLRRAGCRFLNAERKFKIERRHTCVAFGTVIYGSVYFRLARKYVEVAARARIKTHGHGIHKRKQFIDNILSDFQLDIGIFHAYQGDERLDDVCGFRRKRAGSISAGSCVSGGVSVRKRLGCRVAVRIGTAFGDSVKNRGKVDIKAAHERAEVTGKFLYNFGSFHLDGAHAYVGKVKPQIAVAHIYAYQRGSLVDSHIIQLEADHVQLYVILRHGSVEREHEVDADGFAVLLGNEFKRGIAQVDYAADHLLGNAQQVEALLRRGVRGQAECDSRSKYFVKYARDQSGGIRILFRCLYLAVLFGNVLGNAYFTIIAGHGAAYADTRVEGNDNFLAAESTGRGYPQRFISAFGLFSRLFSRLFSQTYGHLKVHGRNVRGNVRHQRKQTEYGLRSDDELQLGAVYRQIVVISQTGGRQRRLRRAAFGGEHYGAAFFACGKFQAVISVAGGILGIYCDIVACLRNRGVAAAYGMRIRFGVIAMLYAVNGLFNAFRTVDGFKSHTVADIFKRYIEVNAVRISGHTAAVGQIEHSVAAVEQVGNGAFELYEVAFHKLAHIEIGNLIYGERDSEYGDCAQVDNQRIFAYGYGYCRALLNYKAVSVDNRSVGLSAEGYAVGEGYLHHKAAVIDVFFVQSRINAQVRLYNGLAFRSDGPGKFVTEVFGNVVGQERSDYLGYVVGALFEVDIQFRLNGKSVGENGSNAFDEVSSVHQRKFLVIADFSRNRGRAFRSLQGYGAFDVVTLAVVDGSVFVNADSQIRAAVEYVEVGYACVDKRNRSAAGKRGDEFRNDVARSVQINEVTLYRKRGQQRGDRVHNAAGSRGRRRTACDQFSRRVVRFHSHGVVAVCSAPHDIGVSLAVCGNGGLPERSRSVGKSDDVVVRAVHGLPGGGEGCFIQRNFNGRNTHFALYGYYIRVGVRTVHADGERSGLVGKIYSAYGIGEGGGVVNRSRKVGYDRPVCVCQLISFSRAERICRLPGERHGIYRLIVRSCLRRLVFIRLGGSVEQYLFGGCALSACRIEFGVYLYEVGFGRRNLRGVYAGSFVEGEAGSVRRARIEQQSAVRVTAAVYLIIYAACRAVLVPYEHYAVFNRVRPEIQVAGEVHESAEQTAEREVFRQRFKQIHKHSVKSGIGDDVSTQSEVTEIDVKVVLLVKQYLRNGFDAEGDSEFDYLLAFSLPQLYCKPERRCVGSYAQVDGFEHILYAHVHAGNKSDYFAHEVGYAGRRVGQSDGKFKRAVEQLVEQPVKQRVVRAFPTVGKRIFNRVLYLGLYVAAYMPVVCKVDVKGCVETGTAALFGSEQVAAHARGKSAVSNFDFYNRLALQELASVEVDIQSEGRKQVEHAGQSRRRLQQAVIYGYIDKIIIIYARRGAYHFSAAGE